MRRMYSENQVQKLIQEAIDNQEIKLYEDIDIVSSISFDANPLTDLTFTKHYCSIRKTKENELYLVVNFSAKNNGESAIALSNYICIDIALPAEIASKIYDLNGDTASTATPTKPGITSVSIYCDEGIYSAGYYVSKVLAIINKNVANVIRCQIRNAGSIPAGAEWNYSFRAFLTL